jgi:hypothetical protein
MYIMYDTVTLDAVPNAPHAVACYRNGKYANETEARKRFPHARILPISVAGIIPCEAYDVETGDYRPDQCAELYTVARANGLTRPCFYANLSTMPAIKQSLSHVVKDPKEVRLWVAIWDGTTVIPHGYDAKQFTDRALGRNLDESICVDDFFTPAGKTVNATHTAATATVKYEDGKWSIASA